MSVSSIERPVSALRQRMLDDMAMRGLRSDTQRDYIRFVRSFAAFLGRSPDTAQAEDIRRFQVHQRESGVQPPTINCSVSALRFFFTVTLDRPDLSRRLVLARYPGSITFGWRSPAGSMPRWCSAVRASSHWPKGCRTHCGRSEVRHANTAATASRQLSAIWIVTQQKIRPGVTR